MVKHNMWSQFRDAVGKGAVDEVKDLIELGVNVNEKNTLALHKATENV